ncbi:arginine repressor [Streptococcus dentiloxodontae]
MKKNERLELIRKIVQENDISTQSELVDLLRVQGLKATQATVSRDINEIGITKVPTDFGAYVYGLSNAPRRSGQLSRGPKTLIKAVRQGNFLNIEVQPGNSRLIKKALLNQFNPLIFSLIADDDSLLLLAVSDAAAADIHNQISSWIAD